MYSLTLEEVQRLMVSQNRQLRKLFWLKWNRVTGDWRKLHHDQFQKNEMDETCGTYGQGRGTYMVLVGKPEVKRLLGRPKHRWDDNIRRYIK
jgi:hypothetical protein